MFGAKSDGVSRLRTGLRVGSYLKVRILAMALKSARM
jgi:hypothetical protein